MDPDPLCSTKKRPADEVVCSTSLQDESSVDVKTSTSNAANEEVIDDLGSVNFQQEEPQEPCPKKPRLSKKELLLQAKARLKEAQEKRNSLLETLEVVEKKAKEKEELHNFAEDYDAYDAYYYEYEYHIPPVTGAKESLLITEIDTIGPAEKLRFVQQGQQPQDENIPSFCMEDVLKVVNARKQRAMTQSPTCASGSVPPTDLASGRATPSNSNGKEPSSATANAPKSLPNGPLQSQRYSTNSPSFAPTNHLPNNGGQHHQHHRINQGHHGPPRPQ